VTGDGEGEGDDDLDTTSVVIRDILANLDQGAAEFAREVQAHPVYIYNLMGRLCAQLHLLKEQSDLLQQSNTINKGKREQLAAVHSTLQGRLQDATEKIAEFSREQNPEGRASAQLKTVQEKNVWYAKTLKEAEQAVNNLNNEVADFATANEGLATANEELGKERDHLQGELDAVRETMADRGRSPSRHSQHREPAKSLSPWSREHLGGARMAPPPLPASHKNVSKNRVRSQSPTVQRQLRNREGTAATDQSGFSNASRASVNLDPMASMAIKSDRTVDNPSKFDGKIAFYPWLTSLTLKLSTTTFREEADGLRFVQGFLSGAPWASVAPRIPTLGGWGKPCPNPFTSVDELITLLQERYGEDNTEEKAMTAMVTLRQSEKQDFNDFYASYQEYAAYCPMGTQKQEVHRLQGKLSSRFRNKLADGMDITSVKELVARCIRLQAQWESIDAATVRQPRSQSKNRGRRNNKTDDAPASAAGGSNTKYTGLYRITLPDSELPREYRNMPPLTSEVRQTLRDSGGCYKCRKTGHTGTQRDKCPLAILEDAYEKCTKVNNVDVEDDSAEQPGNGIATR
jgi:hypothetical protein